MASGANRRFTKVLAYSYNVVKTDGMIAVSSSLGGIGGYTGSAGFWGSASMVGTGTYQILPYDEFPYLQSAHFSNGGVSASLGNWQFISQSYVTASATLTGTLIPGAIGFGYVVKSTSGSAYDAPECNQTVQVSLTWKNSTVPFASGQLSA